MDKSFAYKHSVVVKSLALMIFLSMVLLLGMEITSFYFISIYEKGTMENYRGSVEMYCTFWDNKLENINNSILTMGSQNSGGDDYRTVCYAKNELDFQTGKMLLIKRMSEIAWSHENEIQFFAYIPSRNVFLKSTNNLVSFDKRITLNEDIQTYINQIHVNNTAQWEYFRSGQEDYFIQTYAMEEGYIGAILMSQTILDELEKNNQIISKSSLTDQWGKVLFTREQDNALTSRDAIELSVPIQHIGSEVKIWVKRQILLRDKSFMLLFSLLTVVMGLLILAFNIRYQVKHVLGPLNMLRSAMVQFSQGMLEVRLHPKKTAHKKTKDEISILFGTFNEMAEQIVHLKIDIYENKIKQEKVERNFLRVQIQPHFYTNILNLIYGLAQVKDYHAIQNLSMATGSYFRYLLGDKGSFVPLGEEVDLVKNYIQIQQIRYAGDLTFSFEMEEGLEHQMVLPMILQTFTENSVKHNITLVPLLQIHVSITEEEGKLRMMIEDNGKGFHEETLDKIRNNENMESNGQHIGMTNMLERLRIFYGDSASISIDSAPGKTTVTIVMPKITN